MKRFQMFITPELLDRLKALSEQTKLSIAEHIRCAIEAYLRRQK